MKEPAFITYANSSLSEKPEVFYEISKDFLKSVSKEHNEYVNKIIEYFVRFVKGNSCGIERESLLEESRKLWRIDLTDPQFEKAKGSHPPGFVEKDDAYLIRKAPQPWIAFETVCGNTEDFCQAQGCFYFIHRIFAFDVRLLRGSRKLKCYECDQLFFKKILEGLVKGKDYFEIPERFKSKSYYVDTGAWKDDHFSWEKYIKYYKPPKGKEDKEIIFGSRPTLSVFLFDSPSMVNEKAVGFSEVSPNKLELKSVEEVKPAPQLGSHLIYNAELLEDITYKSAFTKLFLEDVISFSLSRFLLHNDPRKVKHCPYCEKFFIAKDIKRQRCYSNECNKEYERLKKQKQREDDPVKYY